MKKTSADDAPFNGRTGHATWRAGAPPMTPTGEHARGADRIPVSTVRTFSRPPLSPNAAAAVSLLALATTIILLTAGLALAGALIWPKTYAARAEILFPITQEQPTGFLREDRSMTTQLVLIRGRAVLDPIAKEQQRSVEDLQEHLTVAVVESSEIIELRVTDRSPERALQTVQAVVSNYLGFSQAGQPTLRERLATELAAVNTAVTDAQARLSAQEDLVTGGTATADTVVPLQSALQAQQSRQQQIQAQLDLLNLAPVAQLLTAPYPAGTVNPGPMFVAAVGALVGLLLAAVVVAVVARSRTTRE
ncbi:MAG: hypothetical protein ACRDTC_13775 [Pseudonocardiaceae bacterium]